MSLDLDNTYLEYDERDALYGLERQNLQFMQAFEEASQIKIPASYKKAEQIVFLGLGASALPGAIARAVFEADIKVPILCLSAGEAPKFVSAKTLVIAISHFGNTDAVLESVKAYSKKKAKIVIISTGGKLVLFAKREKLPVYKYDVRDLAIAPTFAGGFMLGGLFGILKSVELLKIAKTQTTKLVEALTDVIDSSESEVKSESNPAKIVASELHGRPLLVLASAHLLGSATAFAHYVEELGGQSAQVFSIAEAGVKSFDFVIESDNYSKPFEVVILKSDFYSKRENQALEQLAGSLEERGVSVVDYEARGKSKLEEAGEIMQFGLFVGYYLALLNKMKI